MRTRGLALIVRVLKSIGDTLSQYSLPGGGFHPDRAKLHEEIHSHFLGGGEHADLAKLYADHATGNAKKHAVFVMGGSGSGKSRYTKDKFLKHPRFVHIDPDSIKERLPEYNPKDPEPVHEESSHLAKQLMARTMSHGKSFVYEGTGGKAESLMEKMNQARDAGYHVTLHHVHAPLETALARNQRRERTVPEHVAREIHANVGNTFRQARALAHRSRVIVSTDPHISPFAQRREALMNKSHSAGRRHVRVKMKDNHYIDGVLENGMVHVEDIVHNGHSEVSLTGHRPALRPISIVRLKRMGGQVSEHRSEHRSHHR